MMFLKFKGKKNCKGKETDNGKQENSLKRPESKRSIFQIKLNFSQRFYN